MRRSRILSFVLLVVALAGTHEAIAGERTRNVSSHHSPSRAEYDRQKRIREQQRNAEKLRLERGPTIAELRRAGHPIDWAKKFIATARRASRAEQLRGYVTKREWEGYESSVERFDPEYARKKLAEVRSRTGRDAERIRRTNTHPSKKFVEKYREIGRKVLEITDGHQHPSHKFKVVLTEEWRRKMFVTASATSIQRHHWSLCSKMAVGSSSPTSSASRRFVFDSLTSSRWPLGKFCRPRLL